MVTGRYYCSKCNRVESFDLRRKTHTCFICKQEMRYMYGPVTLGDTLYNGGFFESKLVIPDGVKKIESDAFSGSRSLNEIEFPDTLEEISSSCFSACRNLKQIVMNLSLER